MGARGPKSAAALVTPVQPVVRCSFCEREEHEGRRLIADPKLKVFICSECIEAAHELCKGA